MHLRAGVRAILRQPALVLGEIAWRWAFGAAAWTLVVLAIDRILAQVDVTQAELLIARHSDLFLIADACARILVQVLPQLARECAVLAPAIAVLWIAAATVGRAVTVQALLSTPALPSTPAPASAAAPPSTAVILSEASPAAGEAESKDTYRSRIAPAASRHFFQLALLNALRALFTLATLIALFGALLLAGMTVSVQNLAAAAAASVVATGLVGLFWALVNWFLALAPIWIVRDGRPALSSIGDSVNLYRRLPGPYAGIAGWFGLLRAVAFVAALLAALIAAQASPAAAIALCVVIALVYFAVADFLYVARLAAFVALEESCQLSAIRSQPVSPAPQPLVSPEA